VEDQQMANLDDLAILLGKKSVSDMTETELYEHLRQTRLSRRTTKSTDLKRTEKQESKPAKKRSMDALDVMLKSLPKDVLAKLLKEMGGIDEAE
jgi:hypothetical protein